MAVAAVGLVPWIIALSFTLPEAASQPRHWTLAWVGLDMAIAIGFASTAWLGYRRHPAWAFTSAVTGTLLIADGWFDLTTASQTGELTESLILALGAEFPAGLACLFLSYFAFRPPSRRVVSVML